jgi:hypothetical protein
MTGDTEHAGTSVASDSAADADGESLSLCDAFGISSAPAGEAGLSSAPLLSRRPVSPLARAIGLARAIRKELRAELASLPPALGNPGAGRARQATAARFRRLSVVLVRISLGESTQLAVSPLTDATTPARRRLASDLGEGFQWEAARNRSFPLARALQESGLLSRLSAHSLASW